ncbi:MAG: DUF4271 domain-containing protein [Dysgonamonadaceae bacterium]|nr:DUF4271 domain-containing protein [Dysgonamonadaceae bacterium]
MSGISTIYLPEENISEMPQLLNGMFILFLFCFIMISAIVKNNGKLFSSMIHELFRKEKRKSIFFETIGGEFYDKIKLCLQTVIIFSIFIYKVFAVESHLTALSVTNTYLIIGKCSLALILFLVYKWITYFIIGKIFLNKEVVSLWMENFTSLTGLFGICIFIPVLFMFYVDFIYNYCYFIIVFCLFLFSIMLIYRVYVLFFHRLSRLLYLFLYLCAQEIIPLLILYKCVVYFCLT